MAYSLHLYSCFFSVFAVCSVSNSQLSLPQDNEENQLHSPITYVNSEPFNYVYPRVYHPHLLLSESVSDGMGSKGYNTATLQGNKLQYIRIVETFSY